MSLWLQRSIKTCFWLHVIPLILTLGNVSSTSKWFLHCLPCNESIVSFSFFLIYEWILRMNISLRLIVMYFVGAHIIGSHWTHTRELTLNDMAHQSHEDEVNLMDSIWFERRRTCYPSVLNERVSIVASNRVCVVLILNDKHVPLPIDQCWRAHHTYAPRKNEEDIHVCVT